MSFSPLASPTWHLTHAEYGNRPWAVQEEALRRAGDQTGYAFWLEMGLGKTPLALNEFYDKYIRQLCDACVVLGPNSFKLDWAVAVEEWGLGSEITGIWWPNCELPDRLEGVLLSVNYEAATRKGQMRDYLLWLMDQSRIYLVIDESTAIANYKTDTTRAVVELAKRAVFIRELNGTPLAKDVMDYYGQLRAIRCLSGMNPLAFRARYAQMGGYMGKQVKGIKNEEELTQILDQCSFRALKKDWRKDLPPKTYNVIHVEMTRRQQRHYLEMMEDFYTQVSDLDVDAAMVLVQMEKLRQIASCLVLQNGRTEWIEKGRDIPKVRACLDWIAASKSKAIITCIYKDTIAAMNALLEDAGLRPAVIRGGMSPQEWAEQKRRFNETYECRVLLGQQSAVFRGHTLIGRKDDPCSRHFFLENNFSYYERAQLEDRIHRGAQQETCSYTDVVTSPIDTKMLGTVRRKRDQASWMDDLVALVRERRW